MTPKSQEYIKVCGITKKHMELNNPTKMNVKYFTQVGMYL